MYQLDGENVTLADFIEANEDLSVEQVTEITNLQVGKSISFGGGAAPVFVLTRIG